MYVLFLSLQIMLSSNSWKGFQQFSSINVYEVLNVMLKSRADSTTKAYVRVIRKFLDWSKSRQFNMQLPFPLSVVSLYLFEVQQSTAFSSSVILAHAALKWLHSFVPSWIVILYIVNLQKCHRISKTPEVRTASYEKEAYFHGNYKAYFRYS